MNNDLKFALATKIKAARARLGVTQEELASQIRKTPESVSNIERGLHAPAIDTLVDLARALGVPLFEFFEDFDAPRRVSPRRAKLEARLRETARELTDKDLEIVVRQASVFLPKGKQG